MFEIRVNATESLRRLQKFAATVSPENRLLLNRKAAVVIYSDVIRTFDAQGATFGRPRWAPLKTTNKGGDTGRWKGRGASRRFETVYKLLQDTGALRASYLPLSDENVAGVGAVSLREHADLAPIHQFGAPARGLPARPMLPTDERALAVVVDVYGLAIEQGAQP